MSDEDANGDTGRETPCLPVVSHRPENDTDNEVGDFVSVVSPCAAEV